MTLPQVGADIRASQKDAGLIQERLKRQNHKATRVAELLAVPRYADVIVEEKEGAESDTGEGQQQRRPGLIKSREAWRV